jgi:hypothetical protein
VNSVTSADIPLIEKCSIATGDLNFGAKLNDIL